MVAYRFLRPDDLPLIAEAINACYIPHFEGMPPVTLDDLKRESRELNLWASSCMIAIEGNDPIAILVGAKREGVTNILRIGVAPGFEGNEHGTHLVTSLLAKLAIVGPPELRVEVPEDRPRVVGFFKRLGFKKKAILTDWESTEPLDPVPETEAIQVVSVDELLRHPDLWAETPWAWQRSITTITNRKDTLQGLALIADDRFAAFLIHDTDNAIHRISKWQTPRDALSTTILLRRLSSRGGLSIPKLAPSEDLQKVLQSLGFTPIRRHTLFHIFSESDSQQINLK